MIYSDSNISNDTLKALGVRDYMTIDGEDHERLVQTVDDFVSETDKKKFLSKLESFGNPFNRLGRALAVLDYINKSVDNAANMYSFCTNWVMLMSYCNKAGYYDGRNSESVEISSIVVNAIHGINSGDDVLRKMVDEKFLYCVEYGMHRTIQQSLSDCFLIGLVASAEKLGYNEVITALLVSFDVEDSVKLLKELRLPLI